MLIVKVTISIVRFVRLFVSLYKMHILCWRVGMFWYCIPISSAPESTRGTICDMASDQCLTELEEKCNGDGT